MRLISAIHNGGMNKPESIQEQNHPLYSIDRENVDRLLSIKSPEDGDFVELARLFIRYEGFPGALDIQEDLTKTLSFWGIVREELNEKTKKIWGDGFRPGQNANEGVGSGFDTSDEEVK